MNVAMASFTPSKYSRKRSGEDNIGKGFFEAAEFRAVIAHHPADLVPVFETAYVTGGDTISLEDAIRIMTLGGAHSLKKKAGLLGRKPKPTEEPEESGRRSG